MIKVQFDDFRKSQKSIIQDANAELLIKNRDEDISMDD